MKRAALIPLCALLAVALPACRTTTNPASVPSDQRTPLVLNSETVDVLTAALEKESPVLASALEANPENGSVIFIDHRGIVYDPDGNVMKDKDGNPLRMRTQIVAKLNSLQDLKDVQGIEELEYLVGGHHDPSSVPDRLRHMELPPEALWLKVKGAASVKAESPTATIVASRAVERDRILAGLSVLTRERYSGINGSIQAMADGLTKIVDSSGRVAIGVLERITPVGAVAGVADKLIVTLSDPKVEGSSTNYEVLPTGAILPPAN